MDKTLRIRFKPALVHHNSETDEMLEVNEITDDIISEMYRGIEKRDDSFRALCRLHERLILNSQPDGSVVLDSHVRKQLIQALQLASTELNTQIQEMEMFIDFHNNLKSVTNITKQYIPEEFHKSDNGNETS